MSEPVSNAEIEDVLSSIRRLVSGEPGGARRVETAPEGDDRFVLTPALRVSEDPISTDDTEDHATDKGGEPEAQDASSHRGLRYDESLEQRIAELELVIAQSPGDWEPDGSETDGDASEPLEVAGARMFRAQDKQQDAPDAEIADAEVVVPPEDAATPEPDSHTDSDEAWQSGQDQAPEAAAPREPAPAPPPDDHAEDLAAQLDSVLARVAAGSDAQGDVENLAAEDGDAARPEADDIESDHAETDHAETDHTETDHAETDDAETDDAETDDIETGDSEIGDRGERIFDLSSDETVIDEESLRLMVADMVREELQGVLGERITRNVRRLVRREIQRALATRDLDID